MRLPKCDLNYGGDRKHLDKGGYTYTAGEGRGGAPGRV